MESPWSPYWYKVMPCGFEISLVKDGGTDMVPSKLLLYPTLIDICSCVLSCRRRLEALKQGMANRIKDEPVAESSTKKSSWFFWWRCYFRVAAAAYYELPYWICVFLLKIVLHYLGLINLTFVSKFWDSIMAQSTILKSFVYGNELCKRNHCRIILVIHKLVLIIYDVVMICI